VTDSILTRLTTVEELIKTAAAKPSIDFGTITQLTSMVQKHNTRLEAIETSIGITSPVGSN
jgi:hypothetical protein